jgi:diguanylate cyclase (GGDEF)-like protein
MEPERGVRQSSLDWAAQRLLEELPPEPVRRLAGRELATELAAAISFLAAVAVMGALIAGGPSPPLALTAVLILAYAIAARVTFDLGAGFAVPTQLILVPMLFLLPATGVPLAVAAGLALSRLPEFVRDRAHLSGAIACLGDGWHAVGPALVLGAAGHHEPDPSAYPLYLAALAAQFAFDFGSSTIREWMGRGIAPSLQLRVIGWIVLADVLLSPIAFLAALAATGRPYLVLAVLPLAGLLALFARERHARIEHALNLNRAYRETALTLQARVADLDEERARFQRAIERIGAAFAAKLDRDALLELVLLTAVDALSASGGELANAGRDGESAPTLRTGTVSGVQKLLRAVEDEVTGTGAPAARSSDGAHVLACPLALPSAEGQSRWAVLIVARTSRPFTDGEREILSHLSRQASASFEHVALHEEVRHQAHVDPLTGLANRRRLDAVLMTEIAHAERSRAPLALLLLDLDNFKHVNDRYGHQDGDRVLSAVGEAVTACCRAGDTAARYGGEEIAVALPSTDLDSAHSAAERIRSSIAALRIPLADGTPLAVTASIGVACMPGCAGDQAGLIEAADAALYTAKRTGKNRSVRAAQRARSRSAGAC